jgi:hypothetical protein
MAPKQKHIALPGGGAGKVASQPRKKNPPKTAFQKGKPNPHAFKPGQSGNPSGKSPLADHLLSRNTLVALNNRAPDALALSLNLTAGSSWSQCLAQFLLYKVFEKDKDGNTVHWEAAISLIARLTEANQNNLLLEELERMRRQMAEGGVSSGPRLSVMFVKSNGDGSMTPETKATVDEIDRRAAEGESYEDLVIDAKVVEAERAAAEAEAEAKVKEKSKPKALTIGRD